MAIVTVSRELGSLGTEIADTLCSGLGLARLDKESLEGLLTTLGMSSPQFERADEKAPGFWEHFSVERVRYLDFMKAAMYRFAAERDCLVVGRGAHLIFRGVPGVLRLRVVAPVKLRVERLQARLGVDQPRALRILHQSDRDRAGYHRYFFDAAWDALADYDLVVNTAFVSPAETVETVAALLRSPSRTGAGHLARAALRDLSIAQDVILAIAYRERVPVTQLEVTCDKGVVALDGAVRAQAQADWAQEVARGVPGVIRVMSAIAVEQYPYYPGTWIA